MAQNIADKAAQTAINAADKAADKLLKAHEAANSVMKAALPDEKNDVLKSLSAGTTVIDVTIQTAKMTKEVLKEALTDLVSGNNVKKSGRTTVGKLQSEAGGKLDSIEITDNNIRDFLDVAKKYDIDYALKRDSSTEPPTYHVFFKTADQENFQRAFNEYSGKKSAEISKAPMNVKRLQKEVEKAKNQPRQDKTHHKQHKREEVIT